MDVIDPINEGSFARGDKMIDLTRSSLAPDGSIELKSKAIPGYDNFELSVNA